MPVQAGTARQELTKRKTELEGLIRKIQIGEAEFKASTGVEDVLTRFNEALVSYQEIDDGRDLQGGIATQYEQLVQDLDAQIGAHQKKLQEVISQAISKKIANTNPELKEEEKAAQAGAQAKPYNAVLLANLAAVTDHPQFHDAVGQLDPKLGNLIAGVEVGDTANKLRKQAFEKINPFVAKILQNTIQNIDLRHIDPTLLSEIIITADQSRDPALSAINTLREANMFGPVLREIGREVFKSERIMPINFSTAVRNDLRKKLNNFVVEKVKAVMGTVRIEDPSLLIRMSQLTQASELRDFIKANMAAFKLDKYNPNILDQGNGIQDATLKNLVADAKQQLSDMTSALVSGIPDKIKEHGITDADQANTLMALAVLPDNADNIRAELFRQKDALGMGVFTPETIQSPVVIPEAKSIEYRNTASGQLRSQIAEAARAKIPELKAERENADLIDAIADAKDDELRTTLFKNKDALGLNHLTKACLGNPLITEPNLLNAIREDAKKNRIERSSEEKIVLEALTRLKKPDPTATILTPQYAEPKKALWSDPAAKMALVALTTLGKSQLDEKEPLTANVLAGKLKPLLDPPPKDAKVIESGLKTTFGEFKGSSDLAQAIADVHEAEETAKEVKKQADVLKAQYDKFARETKGSADLATEAKKVNDDIAKALEAKDEKNVSTPASDAKAANAKRNEMKAVETAQTALAKRVADIKTAQDFATQKLAEIKDGTTQPREALAELEGEVKRLNVNPANEAKLSEEVKKLETAFKTIADAAATRVKALHPDDAKIAIPQQIRTAAERKPPNRYAVAELAESERLKKLYEHYHNLAADAASNNREAIRQLKEAGAELNVLLDQIIKLRGTVLAGDPISQYTKDWLTRIHAEFRVISSEMKYLETRAEEKKTAGLVARDVRIFTDKRRGPYKAEELKNIHKNQAAFDKWEEKVRGPGARKGIAPPQPLATFSSREKSDVQWAEQPQYEKVIHRGYPPDPDKAQPHEMIYSETESKQADTQLEPDLDVIVYDLPEDCSNRGYLVDFLVEKLGMQKDGSEGARALVFENLHDPVLKEKDVLAFLKKIPTGRHRDTSLAREFMVSYLPSRQYTTFPICDSYVPKGFAYPLPQDEKSVAIDREAFKALSIEEKQQYKPAKWGGANKKEVQLPDINFFHSAALLINTFLARGSVPMSLVEVRDPALLLAIDCLAQAKGVSDKLQFPSSYKKATPDQVEATTIMIGNEKLRATQTGEALIKEVKAATTGADRPTVARGFADAPEPAPRPGLGRRT